MKLQLPATSAVPAAVAAAAIAFALLLFPGGGTSVRSVDVAPALGLVGDVATVVRTPVRSVTKAQPKSVVASPSASVAATPAPTEQSSTSATRTHSVRAHRVVSRRPATPPTHVVKPTPVQAPVLAAPRVITQSVKHGNGKARALGHLKKTNGKAVGHRRKSAPHASSQAAHGGGSKNPAAPAAAVSHGPPAVPPGQAKKTSDGSGASNGRGGGK